MHREIAMLQHGVLTKFSTISKFDTEKSTNKTIGHASLYAGRILIVDADVCSQKHGSTADSKCNFLNTTKQLGTIVVVTVVGIKSGASIYSIAILKLASGNPELAHSQSME